MALSLQYFRSYVIRCAAYCFFLLSFVLQLGGQTEVAQLDLHVFVQEEVTEFEISMDDFVLVQILQGIDDLCQIALHFNLGQPFSSFNKLVESLHKTG